MKTTQVAFLIGVVAGLRSMTAPAAVSWAAKTGALRVKNTELAFLGSAASPYILCALAVGELVADKLPQIPGRKEPGPFIVRILSGGLCGAAIGATSHTAISGLLAGALGAVAGTLGGSKLRSQLVRATGGNDWPAALLEDSIAIGSASQILSRVG